MRKAIIAASILVAFATWGCGASSKGAAPDPKDEPLDRDYSQLFAGSWTGTGSTGRSGTLQPFSATMVIARTGYNALSLTDICPGVDATARVDTPTTFAMGPVSCPSVALPCGPAEIAYDKGTGQVAVDTLALTLHGTVTGCGTSYDFVETFAGTPGSPSTDHGPPSAVVASSTLGVHVGVPIPLDARGSSDPDARSLTFIWTVVTEPVPGSGSLSRASTATPTFTAGAEGEYVLNVLVTADDGQTDSAAVTVTAVAEAKGTTVVRLASDPGDWVGGGREYEYTRGDAVITVSANGGHLSLGIDGDEWWNADFVEPSSLTRLAVGTYPGLTRYPFHDPAVGGLSWSGEGRGCNTLTGWFAIDSVVYDGSSLVAIDLRFEQHCEGGSTALRGEIHWDAGDTTPPPGPVNPPPAGLWQPAPGSTPGTGNYVYLQSDPGDYVGLGQTLTYTQADGILAISATDGHLSVSVDGDTWWNGNFQTMNVLSEFRPGYYGSLRRYPFHNPARGGLDWSGDGRGCNELTGWFTVDAVTYAFGYLQSIDLRFEQHCEGGSAALHGKIHWAYGDATQPPGPVNPPPAGLWQPAPGATPATGNYVYLVSDAGDYIGGGRTYTYTPVTATLTVTSSGGHLGVQVSAPQEWWTGDFQAMSGLARLEPGYYGSLLRYPFHNPARGGLDWSGDGRGCNTLGGWFVVDEVVYSGDTLTSVDLRFEQHCERASPALRGKVHWTASGG